MVESKLSKTIENHLKYLSDGYFSRGAEKREKARINFFKEYGSDYISLAEVKEQLIEESPELRQYIRLRSDVLILHEVDVPGIQSIYDVYVQKKYVNKIKEFIKNNYEDGIFWGSTIILDEKEPTNKELSDIAKEKN